MRSPDGENDAPPPPWERISSEMRHEYSVFRTRRDRVRAPDDGEEHDFDVVESPDAVTVVALTEGGEIVMVEQFRHGTREVVLEFPGGVVDQGEDPAVCAERELREETGYGGGRAASLGPVDLNPAWQSGIIHLVRIHGVRLDDDKELDQGEDTRVRLYTVDELRERVRDGSLRSAVAVAALAMHLWIDGESGAR